MNKNMTFYKEFIEEVQKQEVPAKGWATLKRDFALKFGLKKIPSNIDILMHAPEDEIPVLLSKLLTKPTRTISGVSPVAIMTKPDRCPHGKCTFCPGGVGSPWGDVPQSYTGHEPATMRGIRNDYDSYLQVFNRLQQYVLLGQNMDKIEIIIMGGTFTATQIEYQNEFVYGLYKAMNDFSDLFFVDGKMDYVKFKEFFELPGAIHDKERALNIKEKLYVLRDKGALDDLEKEIANEQLKNETTKVRCVALCIETKPDWGFLEHGNVMLEQGCTRVELGIQSVYDDVLKEVHRGHDSADSKRSIQILRDLGFKINFHYMPGLPLTDRARDIAGMKQLFTDEGYKPDMIKFYPCMIGPATPLYYQWKAGKFNPIDTEEAMVRIIPVKKIVPEYCRIQRIQRDVPTKYWEAGVDKTNFRQIVHQQDEMKCRCIRCREPKGQEINWSKVEIKVDSFEASGGKEFFISVLDVQNDLLIGFCRLRFPKEFLRSEIIDGSALIRELHVYGTATAVGEDGLVQHKGWGTKLMAKAEKICIEHDKRKIVVISGVGVKEYYSEKLGYHKEGPYMVKEI
jgi:elongator complex protein 3